MFCPHEAGYQQRCLPNTGSCTASLPFPGINTPEELVAVAAGSVLLASVAAVGIICAVQKAQKKSHIAANNDVSTNDNLPESLLEIPLVSNDDKTEVISAMETPKVSQLFYS